MLWAKIKLFFWAYWIWFAVAAGVFVAVVLPMWYLSGMEESIRRYIIGINVASLPWGILQTLVFVAFLYLLQYGGGFARFKKARIDARDVKVRFSDVIGLTEAKREAIEVVQLLKDRSAVRRLGGNIMRGVLLMGPPGCGKTLLAKAIATEAGIPFFSVAGSEFVEIFVGVGAARVRKLFRQSRQYAQAYGGCIIFIDELEVLGRSRVFYDAFGGSSEGNSTLNQLLVEMDGLHESDAHVLVIGAMNADVDVLDPALLRPGRFDRRIEIGRPNLQEREEIFRYYAKKIRLEPGVDMARLARKAIRKTPAEIENILKESALIAARGKKDLIGYKEITAAIERIELGIEHRLNLTPHEREMTAYHEAGHLVILYLIHPTDDVFKASIIQRGGVLGVVHHTPREEIYSNDRNTWLASIKVSLGGYVSEKLKYGVTSDGVSSDFQGAMFHAHTMVWRLGMGTDGLVGDFKAVCPSYLSESLKDQLNEQTQVILHQSYVEVEAILKAEWRIVERFAAELLKRDELDYDEIVQVFLEYGKQPLQPGLPVPPVLPAGAQTLPPPNPGPLPA
ncbi:MAG: AAA family ATPase [Elusimicrobia bacterium]|nr:AAA family ATPase [Elusimicrobiota bacterium]